MAAAKSKILIIPGLFNSGPKHWQSLWQAKHPEYVRVMQGDWARPRCEDWITMLDKYVAEASGPVVLVGHSLGCATIAHWAGRFNGAIKGALLVAPSDPEAATYTFETEGFSPLPLRPLNFPSIVVASDNDPYITIPRALQFSEAWGSRLENIGDAGHINADSGFGEWPEGEKLLSELLS